MCGDGHRAGGETGQKAVGERRTGDTSSREGLCVEFGWDMVWSRGQGR